MSETTNKIKITCCICVLKLILDPLAFASLLRLTCVLPTDMVYNNGHYYNISVTLFCFMYCALKHAGPKENAI